MSGNRVCLFGSGRARPILLGKDRFECARTGLNTQFIIEGYEIKLGERMGLDTPVVLAVNDGY